MGTEVQRVSRDPEVTGTSPPTHSDQAAFGRWLCEQRQLRGLSRCFIAARTRIARERIEAIELGRVALTDDALGRGTARQLAHAVGADPDEALSRMGATGPARVGQTAQRSVPALLVWTGALMALAAASALLYLGALWLERGVGADPGVVYRPDYVGELLERVPPQM